jgi:hypothetical protein
MSIPLQDICVIDARPGVAQSGFLFARPTYLMPAAQSIRLHFDFGARLRGFKPP